MFSLKELFSPGITSTFDLCCPCRIFIFFSRVFQLFMNKLQPVMCRSVELLAKTTLKSGLYFKTVVHYFFTGTLVCFSKARSRMKSIK